MKIFLDDVRDAPDGVNVPAFWDAGWIVVRTAKEAIEFLEIASVEVISLDHDLGNDIANQTGYDVAKWIEERVANDCNYFPPMILIHSANPVGRRNIAAACDSIERMLSNRLAQRVRLDIS